jgi:hypothetical protein
VIAVITAVDGAEPPVTAGAHERLADLQQEWSGWSEQRDAILADLRGFSDRVVAAGFGGVVVTEQGR